MMNRGFYLSDMELLRKTVDEWTLCMEELEKKILKLEVHKDGQLINDTIQMIRKIKDGFFSAGMSATADISHEIELVLDAVKNDELKVDAELIDGLLQYIDYLNSCITALGINIKEHEYSNSQGKIYIEYANDIKEEAVLQSIKQLMANRKKDKKNDKTNINIIQVSQEKLDIMMNMISELLIAKNTFMHISSRLNLDYNLPEISKEVKEVGLYINRITNELQDAIISMRMVEIKTLFQKMPGIVREISQISDKKIELIMEGENTEIDKAIIEKISDPLVHLVKNAAEHGIEEVKERLIKGKAETGRIALRAYNRSKHVYIEIEDDGKGIDCEALKKKAIEKGFITAAEAEGMSRSQLINLIFLPGFSTAKEITKMSGRGVGMDIVKSNIERINGYVTVDSEVDKGTKITIQLPVTLAISRGLTVEAGGDTYIIPLEYIDELIKINRYDIHSYNNKYFTSLRGNVIGLEWLSSVFHTKDRDMGKDEFNAIIMSNSAEKYAIIVDRFKNEQEFVVKTFDGQLANIAGISGLTVLGNGETALILNPAKIIQLAQKGVHSYA